MVDYTIKERQKRWRKRQEEKGKKPITLILNEKTINKLNEERVKTGEKLNELVERAINYFFNNR